MSRRIPIRVAGDDEPECRTEAEGLVEQAREEPEAEAAVEREDAQVGSPAPREEAAAAAEDGSWRGRYLRLQADFENYKRHAEAERGRLTSLGTEAALADIFPLVDHLDRGLAWVREHGADPAVVEGLLLVQKELHKVLEKNGITRLTTIGEAFNPELHEAVSVIARAGAKAGEVAEELQAGFMRDGRVLRPARVVVAG